MSIPKIQTTSDYSVFKKINSNRDINKAHLKKLIASISIKNLLFLFPVILNENMEVVDGQHRIEAAKSLGVKLYYIVDGSITKADIALMNSNRKSWGARDYISFYAEEGNEDFKRLKKLLKAYPSLSPTLTAKLMDATCEAFYEGGGQHSVNIRRGSVNSSHYAMAQLIADLCARLNKHRTWSFDPYFVMDIKKAIIRTGSMAEKAVETIYKKRDLFPKVIEKRYTNHLTLLKDMLGFKERDPQRSESSVKEFLNLK